MRIAPMHKKMYDTMIAEAKEAIRSLQTAMSAIVPDQRDRPSAI